MSESVDKMRERRASPERNRSKIEIFRASASGGMQLAARQLCAYAANTLWNPLESSFNNHDIKMLSWNFLEVKKHVD